MAKKPDNNFDRDKILLLTAFFGMVKVIFEIAIKVVSYVSRIPKLRVQI